jgi:hypothetical protein
MYDRLETICEDLRNFGVVLAGADAASSVRRIADALEYTCQEVSERTRASGDDEQRARLQRIYRGMLAARRLVERLHELPNPGEAAPL